MCSCASVHPSIDPVCCRRGCFRARRCCVLSGICRSGDVRGVIFSAWGAASAKKCLQGELVRAVRSRRAALRGVHPREAGGRAARGPVGGDLRDQQSAFVGERGAAHMESKGEGDVRVLVEGERASYGLANHRFVPPAACSVDPHFAAFVPERRAGGASSRDGWDRPRGRIVVIRRVGDSGGVWRVARGLRRAGFGGVSTLFRGSGVVAGNSAPSDDGRVRSSNDCCAFQSPC